MGFLDIFNKIGSFASEYEKPIQFGLQLFDNYNKQSSSNDLIDAYSKAAQLDYDQQRQRYEATKQYNQEYGAWAQQESASRAAAARANAAARQQAKAKAQAYMNKELDKIAANYKPYQDAALQLLPQMQGAYNSGLQNLNLLSGYLAQPNMMARAQNAAAPVNLMLPKNMMGA